MIDDAELRITAEQAKLELREEEFSSFAAEAARMVEYFDAMARFDASGLEPTTHALISGNVLRDDRSEASLDAAGAPVSEAILEQAPDLEGRLLAIPNVL